VTSYNLRDYSINRKSAPSDIHLSWQPKYLVAEKEDGERKWVRKMPAIWRIKSKVNSRKPNAE